MCIYLGKNSGMFKDGRTLKQYKCKICNKELDRDLNASINIKRVGTSTLCESNYIPEKKHNYDSIESHDL